MRFKFVIALGGALLSCGLVLAAAPAAAERPFDAAAAHYVEAWKSFYPSRALSLGMFDAIDELEDRSAAAVGAWIALNRATLARIEALPNQPWTAMAMDGLTLDEQIDRRLLAAAIGRELDRWEVDRPHQRAPGLYGDTIARAFTPVLESDRLSAQDKVRVIHRRLEGVRRLADAGTANLENGRPAEIRQALEKLESVVQSIETELSVAVEDWLDEPSRAALHGLSSESAAAVTNLVEHLREEILPRGDLPDEPILGRDAYARKLRLYTDSDLTPEELRRRASDEISASREAISELAHRYWLLSYPDEELPADDDAVVARALGDLESNRPESEHEYLLELRRYRSDVETFVRDQGIATVPERSTLSLELAPESSGPMARIGFVRSAPPFHPSPWTTWYLATIPDSHPEEERIDFWRSFNYSFKRFIVIHELFPGHYLQLKLLRENPRPVRILFPHRPFIEGWATFSERIVLDAGYAEGDLLTRLAQLRKRLENANRAYTSVQVHCFGWSREEMVRHSVEEALLAPQFAKSLWGRLMRSPMQIITYMLGGLELRELYEAERERRGDAFETRRFMDTILRTGPIPTRDLERVLLFSY